MCGKPLLEEIKRRGLVTSDGNMPGTSLVICNENMTSFAIDTNETSKAFGVAFAAFTAAAVWSMGSMMSLLGSRAVPSISSVFSSTSKMVANFGRFSAQFCVCFQCGLPRRLCCCAQLATS